MQRNRTLYIQKPTRELLNDWSKMTGVDLDEISNEDYNELIRKGAIAEINAETKALEAE